MTPQSPTDTESWALLFADHLTEQQRRLEAILPLDGCEQLLIFSGTAKVMFGDDHYYPFVANPYFRRWLPLPFHADCALLLRSGAKPTLFYANPSDFWHLSAGAPEGFWTDGVEIVEIETLDQIGRALTQPASTLFIGEETSLAQQWGLVHCNPEALLHRIDWDSGIKTDYELAALRRASEIAVSGHRAAAQAFAQGGSEFAINQAYLAATDQRESELPYGNIVALNQHAAVLHYQQQDRQAPSQQRSFLIDAGAQCHGYAADITRSYCAQGSEHGSFSALIEAMEALQLQLCAELRAGQCFVELHRRCHQLLAELLIDQRLAFGSVEALVKQGVTRAFFPHGLGHLLGTLVHDAAGRQADLQGTPLPPPTEHPFLRLTRNLETGMVLTIEPGLYFIESLLGPLRQQSAAKLVDWAAVERLTPYGGIRIEDNLRVEQQGAENMTRDAFALIGE